MRVYTKMRKNQKIKKTIDKIEENAIILYDVVSFLQDFCENHEKKSNSRIKNTIICKSCRSDDVKTWGNIRGKKRYICNNCGYQFVYDSDKKTNIYAKSHII